MIRSLFVSGTRLLAGTNGPMGVYYSDDNGTNWTSATGNLNNNFVLSFGKTGSTLLAGTGCCALSSTDNGASWSVVNTNLGASRYGFAVNGGTVYGATHSTYGATDTGATWTILGSGLGNYDLFSIALHSGALYVGTDGSGVWKLSISTGTTVSDGTITQERGADFSVYPNPSSGKVTVVSKEGVRHVAVASVLGATIWSEDVPDLKTLTVVLPDAPPGVYFITVKSADAIISQKVILQGR
jgi:hypothetical protein